MKRDTEQKQGTDGTIVALDLLLDLRTMWLLLKVHVGIPS